jgi:PAS domain S-box-containing protein
MAPSTGLLLLVLVAGAFLRARDRDRRLARRLESLSALVVFAFGLALFLQSPLGFTLPIESWLVRSPEMVKEIPVGRMSPLTASCFILSAAALLCGRGSSRRGTALRSIGGWIASGVLVVSCFVAASYLLGAPLLYGSATIPMALLTSLAFLLLSLSLLLGAGSEAWPVQMFFRRPVAGLWSTGQSVAWPLLVLFMMPAAGIVVGGILYLNQRQLRTRQLAHRQLESVADLKLQQISSWRKERLTDANLILAMPYVARRALDAMAQPESAVTRRMFTASLDPLLSGGFYERLLLLDDQLNVRLVHPEGGSRALANTGREAAEQALRTGQIGIADLHETAEEAHIHLDLVIPLLVRHEGDSERVPAAGLPPSPTARAAGLLILQVDAHDFLFPLVQTWPSPSQTAETLLVRREGNEVLFLTEPRHTNMVAMKLRRPLEDLLLPAARALRGDQGIHEGIDYRGVSVVASARQVPDTPWMMVSKVDEAELYAPLRQEALKIGGLALALLLASALGVTALWRRSNEHLLREQLEGQKRYQQLFEMESDAIVLVDNQTGRVLEANQAACTLYGYTREEWLTMNHTDVSAETAETRRAALQEHVQVPVRWHRKRDGTVFPVEISGSHFDWQGRRVHIAAIRDISQRLKAEEALRESERNYREMFNATNDAIFLDDAATGRMLDVNGAMLRMYGYDSKAEVLAGNIGDLSANEPPYTQKEAERRIRLAVEEGPQVFEWLARKRNGERFCVEVSLRSSEIGGQGRILAVVRDITERKKAEMARADNAVRQRILVEQSRDGMVVLNHEGKVREANQRFAEMLGYSLEEVAHLRVWDWDQQWSREELLSRIQRVDARGDHFETRHRRKDGSLLDVEISTNGAVLQGEKLMFCVCRDISQRKRAEEKLAEQLKELQRWHEATLGRESRILDLKRQVNKLLQQSGQPPRYSSVEPTGSPGGNGDAFAVPAQCSQHSGPTAPQ